MHNKTVVVVISLFATLLAGCVSDPPLDSTPQTDEADQCIAENVCGQAAVIDTQTGRDLRVDLDANDTLDAPTWRVGDVFEQHIFYGEADTTGEHIQTMVVDADSACYEVATTSSKAARFHAVFELPILGCIQPADLATTGLFTDWSWMYAFPLADGKSWAGEMESLFNWNGNTFHDYTFTLTATYESAIDTPQGAFPGFEILGHTEDGELLVEYNYVPAVGWFSHLWIYDLSTPTDGDIMFHAMSMGTATDYVGPYLIDEAEKVVNAFVLLPVTGHENLVAPFTVPDDATHLIGMVVAIACPGATQISLLDPDGEQTDYTHVFEGDATGCANMFGGARFHPSWYTFSFYDEPAVPGDWTAATAAAGVAGSYVNLYAIREVSHEMAAPG